MSGVPRYPWSLLLFSIYTFLVSTSTWADKKKRGTVPVGSSHHTYRGSDRMMTGMRKLSPETFHHTKTGLGLNLGLCNQKSYSNVGYEQNI
jgi:hypothetical protein